MLRKYKIIGGKLVEVNDESAEVFFYINPDEKENKYLTEQFYIDEHTLQSAMDPNELSRLEFEDNHTALIFKRPKNYSGKEQLLFKASTVAAFIFKEKLIVVGSEDIFLFEGKQFTKLESLNDVVLKLLAQSINHFIEHLKVISMITDELEEKINKSMENKHLINLFALGKSLIYYLNAIEANTTVINKLKRNGHKFRFTEDQYDLLEDILIENTQCYRQAEIYSSISAGMMDVRASIVNNNINVLMKQLTMINIVFMPLNLIAGIGGMSEFSMMTVGIDWKLSYSLFFIAMIVIGYITFLFIKRIETQKLVEHKKYRRRNTKKG